VSECLYIIANDKNVPIVWKKIIANLSASNSEWMVDCLDCLYDTNLKEGIHSTEQLLYELEENTYIFSARMLSCLNSQAFDKKIYTMDDFFNSNCESVVICADLVHFEIFSKSIDTLTRLASSLSKNEATHISWKNIATCGREFLIV